MPLIKEIHKHLSKEINEMNQLIIDHLSVKEELINLVASYLLESGGKRIRALLTILSGKMFGYEEIDILKLASAVEFIHNATLLHDDVVDESAMRRARPTANIIWGNKASILVGDFLFSQSFKLMVEVGSIEALVSLSKASSVISQGEVAQLSKLKERTFFSKEEYEDIINAKTAELFGSACEMGAIIANQKREISDILFKFGNLLGRIFQIIDDLLDYLGDEKSFGKKIGDDFLEGKVTIALIILHEKVNQKEKNILEKMIAADERSMEDFYIVRELCIEHNIEQDIMQYLVNLKILAENCLNKIDIGNIYKDYLLKLLTFAMTRKY